MERGTPRPQFLKFSGKCKQALYHEIYQYFYFYGTNFFIACDLGVCAAAGKPRRQRCRFVRGGRRWGDRNSSCRRRHVKDGNNKYSTIDKALGLPMKRKPFPRALMAARGVLAKYAKTVGSAARGAVIEI